MEKLIVGFSRPKTLKLFAWLIMKAYDTPYDHVYIKFHSDTYERDIIYQASKLMINFMGTALFEEENLIIKEFELDISMENKKKLMQFAIDNAGKPYSMREVLGLGLVRISELLGNKIKNPFRDGTKAYVCSVLADYICINYTDHGLKDFEDVSPKDLYDYLESREK